VNGDAMYEWLGLFGKRGGLCDMRFCGGVMTDLG
jgi:hypothetical protein